MWWKGKEGEPSTLNWILFLTHHEVSDHGEESKNCENNRDNYHLSKVVRWGWRARAWANRCCGSIEAEERSRRHIVDVLKVQKRRVCRDIEVDAAQGWCVVSHFR